MKSFINKLSKLLLELKEMNSSEALASLDVHGTSFGRNSSYREPDEHLSDDPLENQAKLDQAVWKYIFTNFNEPTESGDSNWKARMYDYTFPQLSAITGNDVIMTLTEQNGSFLQNLFNTIFNAEESPILKNGTRNVDVKFEIIDTNKKEQLDKKVESIVNAFDASRTDPDFIQRTKKFVTMIFSDPRYSRNNYKITLTIPIDRYTEDDLKQICGNFSTTPNMVGISVDSVAKNLIITLTITCNTTLANIYSNVFVQNNTHLSSLEKISWVSKNVREMVRNLSGGKARKFVRPAIAGPYGKSAFTPEDIVTFVEEKSGGFDKSIFCFLDENDNNKTYIYSPGSQWEDAWIFSINGKYENNRILTEIGNYIRKYIEGLKSKEELLDLWDQIVNYGPYSEIVSEQNLIDKLKDMVKSFSSENILDLKDKLTKRIKNTKLLAADKKNQYLTDIIDPIDRLSDRLKNFSPSDAAYNRIIERIKGDILTGLSKNETHAGIVGKVIKSLVDGNTDVYIFRFMYSDKIKMSYSIQIPESTAIKMLRSEGAEAVMRETSRVEMPDDVYVPGTKNMPRRSSALVKKSNLDTRSIEYHLITDLEDVAKTPNGSMYGILNQADIDDRIPLGLEIANKLWDLYSVRRVALDLTNHYYFKIDQSDIKTLLNGNTISDPANPDITYSSEMPSVRVALDKLTTIPKETLLPRININLGTDGKQQYENAFSDFYDAVINMRQQIEKHFYDHKMFVEEMRNKNTASITRESGRPTYVEKIVTNCVNGIEGSVNHKKAFNDSVVDAVCDQYLSDIIKTYFVSELSKMSLSDENEEGKTSSKHSVRIKGVPIKDINPGGSRINISNPRQELINHYILPFLNSVIDSDGEIWSDITTVWDKKELQDTEKMLKFYWEKLCDICDLVKALEKVMTIDNVFLRSNSRFVMDIGVPYENVVDTGIQIAHYDMSLIEDTVDENAISNRKEMKDSTLNTAIMSDIENGMIIHKFVKKNFKPIVDCIKQSLVNFKKDNGKPKAMALMPEKSELPNFPYHTIIYPIKGEDNTLRLIIESTYIRLKDNPVDYAFQFDPKTKSFSPSNNTLANLTTEQKNAANSNMGTRDIVYCTVNLLNGDYYREFIKQNFVKLKENARQGFRSIYDTVLHDMGYSAIEAFDILNSSSASDEEKNDAELKLGTVASKIYDRFKNNSDFNNQVTDVLKFLCVLDIIVRRGA